MNGKLSKALFTIIFGVFLIFAWQSQANDGKTQDGKHPDVDFSISCTECHQEVTPDIVKEWRSTKHGMMNFGCYMCHGDGQEEFKAKPDAGNCLTCHTGEPVDASKGNTNCFDCHKAHDLKYHK